MSDKNDGFRVDAQGYGVGNYLKQYISPGGARRAITESVSPKFQERMETLRDADKGMRETAGNLKSYLANAQKAFKDNRYLDVAHWCAQVDGAVRAMVAEGKPVVDLRDAEIAEFYTRYEDAEPDHDYFSADDGLVSTAGILDRLFGNSIEKLYWKKVKESKLAVQALIKKAEKLITIVLSCLGRMGDARAKGNISAWIEELQRMGKSQSEFQIFARGIYDKHLKELADIVKANKPKPAPVQTENVKPAPVSTIPEASKAEEAAELVEEKPVEVAPKREPGRPTVDEAAKKKEMAQIEQLQSLLNNPVQPAKIEESKPEVNKIEPEIKSEPIKEVAPVVVEAPKSIPTPVVKAPEVQEVHKEPVVVKKPEVIVPPAPAPPVVNFESQEQVPTQITDVSLPETPAVNIPSVSPSASTRPRGRPRLYEPGQSPTDIKKREREARKNQLIQALNPDNKNVLAPSNNVEKSTEVKTPNVSEIPKTTFKPSEKTNPSEGGVDLHKKTIEAPLENSDKKMTMVLLPKIKPDNLDKIQLRLMKELGHPVRFVTREDGADLARDYIKAGWDVQPMTYDEVQVIEDKNKKDPLEMLDDPEFLASLPRLSNGFFDKGRLINDGGETIQNGKVVTVPSKYPEFQNLDKATRQAVIDKINKLQEVPANLIIPVRKEKSEKADIPASMETAKGPEVKTPETNIPEVKTPDIEPNEEEISEEPLSEDEEEMAIYMHGETLEKILKKKIPQINKTDVMQLLENPAYIKSLPRSKDKTFNIDLISKFPEYKVMQSAGMSKKYISVLHNKEAVEKRTKAAGMHEIFFSELQKVANAEDFGLMAAMMCAYSEEIENIDPVTSIKLLQAAEKLV